MIKLTAEQAREEFKRPAATGGLARQGNKSVRRDPHTGRSDGKSGMRNLPIVSGKERIMEAEFAGARARVFTDSPCEFTGKVAGVLDMTPDPNAGRATFVAVLNALLKRLGIREKTLHCGDEEPKQRGREIAALF